MKARLLKALRRMQEKGGTLQVDHVNHTYIHWWPEGNYDHWKDKHVAWTRDMYDEALKAGALTELDNDWYMAEYHLSPAGHLFAAGGAK